MTNMNTTHRGISCRKTGRPLPSLDPREEGVLVGVDADCPRKDRKAPHEDVQPLRHRRRFARVDTRSEVTRALNVGDVVVGDARNVGARQRRRLKKRGTDVPAVLLRNAVALRGESQAPKA